MKNIILATILGIAVIASNQTIASVESSATQSKKAEWKKMGQYWATNLVSGALIGGATGKAFAYAVKTLIGESGEKFKGFEGTGFLLFLGVWIAEMQLRAALVEEVIDSLDHYAIPNKATLIRNIAWASSWIANL